MKFFGLLGKSKEKQTKSRLDRPVSEWTVEDVGMWLMQAELGAYKDTFRQNEISGSELIELSVDDFEQLGIKKLGHRKRLLKLIDELRSKVSAGEIQELDRHSSVLSDTFSDSGRDLENDEYMIKTYIDGEDIRVLKIQKELMTFHYLKEKILSEYSELKLGTDWSIKYKDEDNDFITIRKDSDLKLALQTYLNKTLRLHIFRASSQKVVSEVSEDLVRQYDECTESFEILETLVNPIIIIGEDCKIRYVNISTTKLFGYTKPQLYEKNVTILMPDPYKSNHDDYVNAYLKTGVKTIIGKGRMVQAVNKDGKTFPIWLTVSETIWNNQRAFMGTIQELSRPSSTTNDTVISILETILDAVVIITNDRKIQYFNKSAEEMFGYMRSEVLGKNVNILMPEEIALQHDSYVKKFLETGISKIIGKGRRVTAKRKDGSEFEIWLALAESKWQSKHAFTATIQDMSKYNPIVNHIK